MFNLTFANPFLTYKIFNGQHDYFIYSSKTPPLIRRRIKVLKKKGQGIYGFKKD